MSHSDAAAAVPASHAGVKKLRFDDAVTTTPSASETPLGGNTSGRSALKTSPTSKSPPVFASSMRRSSEAVSGHSDVHVQLNPNPEVIEHDGSVTTLAAVALSDAHPAPATEESAGEVANFLADVGAGLNNGASQNSLCVPFLSTATSGSPAGSSTMAGNSGSLADSATPSSAAPDASERFRTLLLQLSALILEHRPKDPEQYIVDHLNARLLSASAISRAPLNVFDADKERSNSGRATASAAAQESVPASYSQEPTSAVETTAIFQPFGETVVERLANNALSTEVGHAVLLRVAEQLISTQPDDPEDFLWARLEARSFGEEAAHNLTVNAEGYPVVRPEDPAQLALLKDIPTSSPGYVVAVNLLPVLFAKKPADPISYLFYHIGSRARSSAAQSAHSSTHHLRGNVDDDGFDAESCTSREFGDDSDSVVEDVVESGSVSGSTNQLPLQRKGSLGSLFDAAGQSLRRSGGDRSTGSRHRPGHGVSTSRTSSVRRSNVSTAGLSRASRDAAAAAAAGGAATTSASADELYAYSNGGAKRVSIAQQEVQPPSPSHFSYDGAALPNSSIAGGPLSSGPARPTRDSTSTAEPHAYAGPPLPPAASAHANFSSLWKVEADEQARIRQDFELLRLREELRLERLQHEVRTLTRECEYRTRMAVLNRTDRMADRAAAAAREALEEAHLYRGFLCAQIEQLECEQQRQLRMVSQQVARMVSPTSAGTGPLPSPAMAQWLGDDVVQRTGDAAGAYYSSSGASPSSTYGVPSELDILKKQVELLSMEQARAKHCGYAPAPPNRYHPAGGVASARSPYPMQ